VSEQPNSKNTFSNFGQSLRGKALGIAMCFLVAVGVGLFLLTTTFGDHLVAFSYDQPFQNRGFIYPKEATLVYLDDESHARLHQSYQGYWNRAFFTQLLKRMTAEKAKAVVFDLVFTDPGDPQVDKEFAQAMQENSNVILATDYVPGSYLGNGNVSKGKLVKVLSLFDESAADVGSDQVLADEELSVRGYRPGPPDNNPASHSSEAWDAALLYNPSLNDTNNAKLHFASFWMNYYGPETTLSSVSLYKVLTNNDPDVPPGFFSNKVVFVGERLQTQMQDTRKDEYQTPFSYLPAPYPKFMPGVAIHATAFLNLIRGDLLHDLDWKTQRFIICLIGTLFGIGLVLLKPQIAALVGFGALYPIWYLNYYSFTHWHYWFPWIIPIIQISLATILSVAYNTIQIYVEKQKVEQSLGLYLPRRLVKKFASNPELLKPGAKKQMLTILFSDIAGFTTITEGMDPDELAKLMNAYFQVSVDECIHYTEGTIVKYIGDAIFAFWNAPDPQDDHPYRAAEAALRFREQDHHEFNGKKVLTRIGLHTGEANVGNFGSTTRVDYTAFGEHINLTSRMEGLNKYLGTRVLLTSDTHAGLGDRFVTRYVGLFRLKGFEKAVQVYELVDRPADAEKTRDLRERFEQARVFFVKKDFPAADAAFRRVLELNPHDGPSQFYLDHMGEIRSEELPLDWKGDITLKDK
jgi:adenylate cyclase